MRRSCGWVWFMAGLALLMVGEASVRGADCFLPDGTVVFEQPPDCSLTAEAEVSVFDSFALGEVRVADDFRFFESLPGPLKWVSWHGAYLQSPSVNPTEFRFYLYADSGGCTPTDPWDTSPILTWSIPYAQANETAACAGADFTYEYCAEIPDPGFEPTPGQYYWIVIQAVISWPDSWGWLPTTTPSYCWSQYVFPLLDPAWGPSSHEGMAFALYMDGFGPLPTATPTVTPTVTLTPTPTLTPTVTPIPPVPTAGPVGLGLLAALLGLGLIRRRRL